MTKTTETYLSLKDECLLITKAASDIRNTINLLFEEIPSLEHGPQSKALDLVFEACDLLDAEQERLLRLMARHQMIRAINEQDCEDDYSHLWHSENG